MPAPNEPPDNAPQAKKLSQADQAELDAINGTIDRMHTLTAPDPYVLTIPQDVEPRYHHAYQYQAMQWLHQAPFEWKEGEVTQYQTFIYHEHGKDMYVLHNSRPREEVDKDAMKSKPATGVNTPNPAAPKKKITLGAYNKKKSAVSTPAQQQETAPVVKPAEAPVKQPAVKGPVERGKAETEEVLAAVEEAEKEMPTEPAAPKKELKRKRSEDKVEEQERQQDAPLPPQDEPATKKARTTSTPPAPAQPERLRSPPKDTPRSPPKDLLEQPSSPRVQPDSTALPPRLSPLGEETLPSRLSPTIPANIAATIAAKEQLKASSSDSSAPNSATKNGKLTPTPLVVPNGVTKHKSPIPRNAFRANSSSPAVRSENEERAKPAATSAPQRSKTPELSQGEEIAIGKALKTKVPEKQSLILRLKYKKHQRDGIRRILKMPAKRDHRTTPQPTPAPVKPAEEPKPEKPTVEKPSVKKRDPNAKGVAQKIGPPPKGDAAKKQEDKPATTQRRPPPKEMERYQPPGKRKRSVQEAEEKVEKREHAFRQAPELAKPADEEPPAKRKKVPDAIETRKDPSTPVQPDLLSPSLISSVQKSQQATPNLRKDHLSAMAMVREKSNDGNHADTPSSVKSSTPVANGHTTQPNGISGKPPSSQPSSKTPMQQAWETEQERLQILGRDLKHAASAHLNSVKIVHSDSSGPKKEQKLAAAKAVESLLAYILAFTCQDEAALAADPKQPPSTKNWRSLHGFFHFVHRNCEPFPVLFGLACQLGVVYHAHILDLTAQHSDQRSGGPIMLETYTALSKYAREAEAKLHIDVLQDSFPRTWEQRIRGALPSEKLTPDDFAGVYKMPLGPQSPPVCAARAGLSMLGEWIASEGVEYEMKLKLQSR